MSVHVCPEEERYPGGILDSSLCDGTSSKQWHTTRFYTFGHLGSSSSWKVDDCPRQPDTIVQETNTLTVQIV